MYYRHFRVFCAVLLWIACVDAKGCQKKFLVHPGHSACLLPAKAYTGGGVFSESDRTLVVNIHDSLRRGVEPQAANMQRMVWDEELESVAKGWASQCTAVHDEESKRRIPGKYTVGQNFGLGYSDVQALLSAWQEEKRYFVLNGVVNNLNEVGNFTQMIWAKSAKVGCACTYADCDKLGRLYVCNYAPAGNQEGKLGEPYVEGTSCYQCPNACNYGLCDCGGKVCENSFTIDLSRCSCSCTDLNPYPTETCSLNCTAITEDVGTNCGQWPCNVSGIPAICPWACNDCPYSGIDFFSGSVTTQRPFLTSLLLSIVVHLIQLFSVV